MVLGLAQLNKISPEINFLCGACPDTIFSLPTFVSHSTSSGCHNMTLRLNLPEVAAILKRFRRKTRRIKNANNAVLHLTLDRTEAVQTVTAITLIGGISLLGGNHPPVEIVMVYLVEITRILRDNRLIEGIDVITSQHHLVLTETNVQQTPTIALTESVIVLNRPLV
jgi:hypothetical protein